LLPEPQVLPHINEVTHSPTGLLVLIFSF
jgi:hypothetical protein